MAKQFNELDKETRDGLTEQLGTMLAQMNCDPGCHIRIEINPLPETGMIGQYICDMVFNEDDEQPKPYEDEEFEEVDDAVILGEDEDDEEDFEDEEDCDCPKCALCGCCMDEEDEDDDDEEIDLRDDNLPVAMVYLSNEPTDGFADDVGLQVDADVDGYDIEYALAVALSKIMAENDEEDGDNEYNASEYLVNIMSVRDRMIEEAPLRMI